LLFFWILDSGFWILVFTSAVSHLPSAVLQQKRPSPISVTFAGSYRKKGFEPRLTPEPKFAHNIDNALRKTRVICHVFRVMNVTRPCLCA